MVSLAHSPCHHSANWSQNPLRSTTRSPQFTSIVSGPIRQRLDLESHKYRHCLTTNNIPGLCAACRCGQRGSWPRGGQRWEEYGHHHQSSGTSPRTARSWPENRSSICCEASSEAGSVQGCASASTSEGQGGSKARPTSPKHGRQNNFISPNQETSPDS